MRLDVWVFVLGLVLPHLGSGWGKGEWGLALVLGLVLGSVLGSVGVRFD